MATTVGPATCNDRTVEKRRGRVSTFLRATAGGVKSNGNFSGSPTRSPRANRGGEFWEPSARLP